MGKGFVFDNIYTFINLEGKWGSDGAVVVVEVRGLIPCVERGKWGYQPCDVMLKLHGLHVTRLAEH
jgi:hypothetical protein